MHVFSFIPDRLLLSRKCCELIHYAGGSCLLSSGSVLFLIHSPCGAYARSRWTPLQPTANLYSRLCGACLLTNGPKERSKESPVRASQHCAAAAIWGDNGGEESKTQREKDRGTEGRRCSQNISLKSSLKSSNCIGSVFAADIQSIPVKTSFNKMPTHQMCLKRICRKQILRIDAAGTTI